MEEWKTIESYPTYEVSSYGHVRRGNKILTPILMNTGYLSQSLSHNGKQKHQNVHRLVAKAFIPNPENKGFVNHKDGKKTNNKAENLEWVTFAENCKHAYDSGLNWTNYFPVHSVTVVGTHIESGKEIEFGSITDACRHIGARSSSSIKVCLSNPNRTAKGWKFRIPDQK